MNRKGVIRDHAFSVPVFQRSCGLLRPDVCGRRGCSLFNPGRNGHNTGCSYNNLARRRRRTSRSRRFWYPVQRSCMTNRRVCRGKGHRDGREVFRPAGFWSCLGEIQVLPMWADANPVYPPRIEKLNIRWPCARSSGQEIPVAIPGRS